MPRLEGTEIDAVTLPVSFSFSISLTEVRDLLSQHIKTGIIDMCWKCTEDGYYIVGLKNAVVDAEKGYNVSQVEKYTLRLWLGVRRFAEPISQEDIAYWASQFSERILFEFFQLGNSPSEIKAEIAVAMERIATSTGVVDEIRRKDPRDSATFVKLKKMIDNDEIKFPKREVDESPKWEIIHLGASDVEQSDSK